MPKKLLLVRHAKSDWNDASLPDFDRPLNHRGMHDAPEMAARLVHQSLVPQQLVSSTALRAISTATIFASVMSIAPENIVKRKEIYEAPVKALLKAVNGLDNVFDFVAMFGHNPGISALASYLTSSYFTLPTCAYVLISFEQDDWSMVSSGTGSVVLYDFPKSANS